MEPAVQNGNIEKNLLILEEHLFLFIYRIIKLLIFAIILSLALLPVLNYFNIESYVSGVASVILFIIGFLYLFLLRKKNTFQITTQRVIANVQTGLLDSENKSANLSKIKDTAYTFGGVFGKIFGYGRLIVHADAEFMENRFIHFENLAQVKEAKLFLDKLAALVEQGEKRENLPSFNVTPEYEKQPTSIESESSEPETGDSEQPDEKPST